MSLGCYRYARQFKRAGLDFDLERAEERAGIMEFDGGLDTDGAEYQAALQQWVEHGIEPGNMQYEGLR
jgi:hypothetical protein